MSHKSIGKLLIERGVLSIDQVSQVLARQQDTNQRFGEIATEAFGVDEQAIWQAWGEQMTHYCPRVDLVVEPRHPGVLRLVTVTDAWEHHLLPLRREDDRLVCATTAEHLPKAIHFARQQMDTHVRFVLADRRQLEQYLMTSYPQ